MAEASRQFAAFASDQYIDAVALLAVLSTKLRATAGRHTGDDLAAADRLLQPGSFVPAEQPVGG